MRLCLPNSYLTSSSLPERWLPQDRQPGQLQDGSLLRKEKVRIQEEVILSACSYTSCRVGERALETPGLYFYREPADYVYKFGHMLGAGEVTDSVGTKT